MKRTFRTAAAARLNQKLKKPDKNCQRYWTAGGAMRKKFKKPDNNYQFHSIQHLLLIGVAWFRETIRSYPFLGCTPGNHPEYVLLCPWSPGAPSPRLWPCL
ncbi:hypothetical protein ACQ4PT_028023 [Festuca glaucescens]